MQRLVSSVCLFYRLFLSQLVLDLMKQVRVMSSLTFLCSLQSPAMRAHSAHKKIILSGKIRDFFCVDTRKNISGEFPANLSEDRSAYSSQSAPSILDEMRF